MANSDRGILHLAWSDGRSSQPGIAYDSQVQYSCDDAPCRASLKSPMMSRSKSNTSRQTTKSPAAGIATKVSQ